MQFEALQVFCDIARCRSFSQAAAANNLSQSAASQIVLQLEKRLCTRLIDRSTRPLQLTDAGRTYYEGCKGLIEQYLELESTIRNAPPPLATTVQVAAIYSVGLGDMGQYVERFMAAHPRVRVQVEYLHPDRVYEKVFDGTADFGLVSFPNRSRELTVLPWREEEMVLACSPRHPLAGHTVIEPAQLDGVKYLGFVRDLVIRREVDRFLREQGVTVELALELDNIESIKKGIEIEAGVALLPEPTVRREVRAGTLAARPLVGCRFVRPLGIIHRRACKLSNTAARFVDLLRQTSHGGQGGAEGHGAFAGGTGPRTNGTARAQHAASRVSRRKK
jgi:DNA-binding transcriptional LysR family regulator